MADERGIKAGLNFLDSGSESHLDPLAGSYLAELLWLLAPIHTFLAAIEEFYNLTSLTGNLCCNNEGALFKSREYQRRILVVVFQADIICALGNMKTGLKTHLTYEWMECHQDQCKLWNNLSLKQQLNSPDRDHPYVPS